MVFSKTMKASGKASSQGTGAFKQVFVDSSQALGARSQALGALYWHLRSILKGYSFIVIDNEP